MPTGHTTLGHSYFLRRGVSRSAAILFMLLALVLSYQPVHSQTAGRAEGAESSALYQRVFGNPANPAVLYLHGGPGYNCSVFEATTAQKLADQGFYVLVYDRRGEGRSGSTAAFTFEETLTDLERLMAQHNIEKATFLGHSFGGIVGIKFAERFPEKVNALVLVGAPLALQESFRTIIKNVRTHYEAKADSTNLAYIRQLETMDTASLAYSSYCFLHAMQAGLYSPDSPSLEAQELYKSFATDSLLLAHARNMGYAGPQGFWKNEAYTTLNLWPELKQLTGAGLRVYGLYGKEDGLYSRRQIRHLEQYLGEANLVYLDHCSHNPFIDQQSLFLALLKGWLSP